MRAIEKARDAAIILLATTSLVLSTNPNVNASILDDSVVEVTTNDEVSSGTENTNATLEDGETSITNVTGGATLLGADALINNEESTSASSIGQISAGAITVVIELSSVTDNALVEDGVSNDKDVHDIETVNNDETIITTIDHVQKYVSVGALNVRECPDLDAEILTSLSTNSEVTVIGIADNTDFVQIEYNGENNIGFVAEEYLSDEEVITAKIESVAWNGQVLNSVNGYIKGPSGYETYYSLPYKKLESIMADYGHGPFTVDDKGVVRCDGYVVVAADLSIRPRGSIVQSSHGAALVCDTGDFVYTDPYQLDILTVW